MEQLAFSAINLNHVSAALIAGTTTTYTTTVTTTASFKGDFGTTLGAQTNTATPTTDGVTGAAFTALSANQATVIVFGVTQAGAIKMCQGSIVDTDVGVTTTAGAFRLAPQFPTLPDTIVPLAYCLVRTSPTGSAFTAGTTAWTASGITTSTFQNVAMLPNRPQTT